MRRLITIFLLVLVTILIMPVPAGAANTGDKTQEIVDQQLEKLDLGQVKSFLEQLDNDTKEYLPSLSFSGMMTSIRQGNFPFNPKDVLAGITRFFFHEVVASSALLGKLIILAVICAVLRNLQSGFGKEGAGELANGVCYLILLTIAAASFSLVLGIGREAIDRMVTFIQAMLPILLTLLAAVGGPTSAAIFHPVLVAAVSVMGTVVKNVVFPLIFFGAILAVVSHVSERFKVTRLAGLFKDISIWILGICLTVMIGIIVIQGVAGSVVDGVGLRTAKYLTGAFLPVVGGMLSDAVEAVVGCSMLLKDSIGLIGVIGIFAICIFPVLKIVVIMFMYKIAAALVQPLGDSGLAESLQTIAGYLTLMFAAVASVGVMMFLIIAAIVGAGSLTVMLR